MKLSTSKSQSRSCLQQEGEKKKWSTTHAYKARHFLPQPQTYWTGVKDEVGQDFNWHPLSGVFSIGGAIGRGSELQVWPFILDKDHITCNKTQRPGTRKWTQAITQIKHCDILRIYTQRETHYLVKVWTAAKWARPGPEMTAGWSLQLHWSARWKAERCGRMLHTVGMTGRLQTTGNTQHALHMSTKHTDSILRKIKKLVKKSFIFPWTVP